MTIAVTAVSGHLGAAIAKALIDLNTGETIIGLARTPSKVQELGIEIRPGDYSARRCRPSFRARWSHQHR